MKRLVALLALIPLACFAGGVGGIGGGTSGGGGASLPTGGLAGQRVLGPTASPTWGWSYGCAATNGGEVNVVDCGADPSNVITSAAQSTAFQAAINTGAKRVVVPGGTYSLATGLTVPSDGTGQSVSGWEMVGLGQPHLILTSAASAVALDISKQRYAVVKNLWIDSTGTKTDGNSTIGIKFEADSSRTVVDHCRIENFSTAGLQAIQPLVASFTDNIINSNGFGYDIEKSGATVPTTVFISRGYVTSNTRGFYGDNIVGGKLDGVTFESNGSSSTNDAAVQLNTGSRGFGIHACYFESNNRNYVFTDSRSTRLGNTYIGAPAGADVITWSGVSATNRANTEITNDTIFGGHFAPDPNAGFDPDFVMARTNPSATGTIKFSNTQSTGWRNFANSGDLLLGVNSSDRLQFGGVSLLTAASTDTLTNKIYVSSTTNPAATGVVRLGNHGVDANEFIGFRDHLNTTTLALDVSVADALEFNSQAISTASNTLTLTNKTLTSPVINGATFSSLTSTTANPAASGSIRLANNSDSVSWRNFANTASLPLKVNASDQLTFNGAVLATGAGNIPLATVTATGDLIVATGSGAVSALPIGSTGQVLTVAGGTAGWATPASSGMSLSPSWPMVPDNGNGSLSGNFHVGGDLDVNGSVTGLGHSGFSQFVTGHSWLDDRYLALNLGTVTPAYVLHTLGQVRHQAIADPSAPTVVNVGTAGSTTRNYLVSCLGPFGGVTKLSSVGTTTTGNATPNASNYDALSWPIPAGSPSCNVYLTDGTHLLGNVVAPANSFSYTGQTPSTVTAITRNSTADTIVDGTITASTSAWNVPVVAGATTQQLIESGAQALTAGAATPSFATAFSSAPVCTCTDTTAAAAVKCSTSSTVLTIAGTSTDTIAYICVGAK